MIELGEVRPARKHNMTELGLASAGNGEATDDPIDGTEPEEGFFQISSMTMRE